MLGRETIASCLAVLLLLIRRSPKSGTRLRHLRRNSIRHRNMRTGNGTAFRKKIVPTPAAPANPGHRRISPAMPETGCGGIKICRPRSNAGRSKTIRNSAGFPRQRQARLQRRLQHFSSLPPQQQERVLNRMETWEHLTTRSEAAGAPALSAVPAVAARPAPGRQPGDPRHARPDARTARPAHQLRPVPERILTQERSLLRGAAHLPLAPGEGLQAGPPDRIAHWPLKGPGFRMASVTLAEAMPGYKPRNRSS